MDFYDKSVSYALKRGVDISDIKINTIEGSHEDGSKKLAIISWNVKGLEQPTIQDILNDAPIDPVVDKVAHLKKKYMSLTYHELFPIIEGLLDEIGVKDKLTWYFSKIK
jgi:hypothetical protein